MSDHDHHHGHDSADKEEHSHFLDQWGTAVVIVAGLIFLTALVSFHPAW